MVEEWKQYAKVNHFISFPDRASAHGLSTCVLLAPTTIAPIIPAQFLFKTLSTII